MTNTKTESGALAGDWDRRARIIDANSGRQDDGMAKTSDTLRRCAAELRAHLESASSQRVNTELPAVRSTAWLDALMDDWVRREGALRLKGSDYGKYDMHERRYFNSQAELMKTLRAEIEGASNGAICSEGGT